MRAILLNGSEKGDGFLNTVHRIIDEEISASGWEVDPFILHDIRINHCLGCFGCWIKTPGICVIDDPGRDVAKSFIQSDLIVFLTPITFGGYSSELKKALDRIICILSPLFIKIDGEVHHRQRYGQYPKIMGVGVLPQADPEEEKIFTTLVKRNAMNMHAPAHTAGIILKGDTPDQIRERVHRLLDEVKAEK